MSDVSMTPPGTETPAGPAVAPAKPAKPERNASLWSDAWHELRRKPTFIIPGIWVLLVVSMAIMPTLWTSKKHDDCFTGYGVKLAPSSEHWFGTSFAGCDFYAQAIYGARPSLLIAATATFGITVLGGLTGVLIGFYGGWLDALVSRVIDIFLSLPFLLGAIVFITVLKAYSVWVIASVLVVLGWVGVARLMRSTVIAAKNLDYVHAAKALGASNSRLMFRHIMPNAVAPVIVVATVSIGAFITTEATLTFLGVGLQPPKDISWGMMISQHQGIFENYPWLTLIPCGLLIATVLSFILVGDALRDALDPKLR